VVDCCYLFRRGGTSFKIHIPVLKVADPHHFNADLGSTFHFNADSDPTFHFSVDPDPFLLITKVMRISDHLL
jgi:hypothetical protein